MHSSADQGPPSDGSLAHRGLPFPLPALPDPRKTYALLLGVCLLAAFLRLWQLGTLPPGFFVDEVATGYDAYTLLQTGADAYGRPWPLFARSLGDYNEALYRYLAMPSVALFGNTEFAVRLPAALAGCLTIVALFVLVRRCSGPQVALWAALCLAISPWHLHFSRIAFRAGLLPLFFTAGLACFALAIVPNRKQEPPTRPGIWLVASGVLFAISLYTYSAARVFVPLFVLGLLALHVRQLRQRPWATGVAALAFLGMLGGLATFWFSEEGMARSQAVGATWGRETWGRYLSYFDPRWLFWQGDPNPRHQVPGTAPLLLQDLLLLPLGLWVMAQTWRQTGSRWLLGWLLLFPVAAALTAERHALRALIGAPAFAWLAGLGAARLVRWSPRVGVQRAGACALALTCLGLAGSWLHRYFKEYPTTGAQAWIYGVREALQTAANHGDGPVCLSNRMPVPFLYVPFYLPVEPPAGFHAALLSDGQRLPETYAIDRFEVRPLGPGNWPEAPSLWVLTGAEYTNWNTDLPDGAQTVHTVRSPDGEIRFALIRRTETR